MSIEIDPGNPYILPAALEVLRVRRPLEADRLGALLYSSATDSKEREIAIWALRSQLIEFTSPGPAPLIRRILHAAEELVERDKRL